MENRLITYSYHALFALTPLIWTSLNYELFEYNKMVFVYFLTIIICTFWALKMLKSKRFLVKKTPLDAPILLFLSANIISTILSIDPHTSWWGYYSRSNGGLLSIISYTLLYYALVANFGSADVPKLLRSALVGGLIAAAWAIPEHFGLSPSCLILTGQANASCWVQDVQARVFSTLGQPNWLATYLAMLIFPALYFFLTASSHILHTTYYILLITYYLAFTFTYSRGPTLGIIAGLIVFLGFYFVQHTRKIQKAIGSEDQRIRFLKHWFTDNPILRVILSFLIINLLFGSALTSFRLVSKFAAPVREAVTEAVTKPTAGTQLETGGTESGSIRLIVWKGALDIFRHYPIFGSGVETFAYSYYRFRPLSHNLVSEWDFLYNKAHNEYLNYLANTGIVGFATYIIIIITFIIFILRHQGPNRLLLFSLLASYISYLVQNFFGFSTVIVAVFFYLFPALVLIAANSPVEIQLSKRVAFSLLNQKLVKSFLITAGLLFLFNLSKLYLADTIFARGSKANEMGNPSKAYNLLIKAVALNTAEPLYRSELSFAAAAVSSAMINEDATLSAKLKDQAVHETEKVLTKSPNNVSILRNSIRAYYLLSTIDSEFNQKTLKLLDRAIELAPTDPKLTYNKAVILGSEDRTKEAIEVLENTVLLKPNYRDAHYALSLFYFEDGQKEKAITQMKKVLSLISNDSEAQEKLKAWEGK